MCYSVSLCAGLALIKLGEMIANATQWWTFELFVKLRSTGLLVSVDLHSFVVLVRLWLKALSLCTCCTEVMISSLNIIITRSFS